MGILSLVLVLAGCQSKEQALFEKVAAELPAARAAATKVGVPMHSRELAPPALRPEDNAAPLLAQATAQFRLLRSAQGTGTPPDVSTLIKAEDAASRVQAAELIEKARRGIDLVVQASEKKGVDFGRDWDTDQPWNILFPEYADLRSAAKWVTARALVRARAGDDRGALSDVLAGFKLAEFAGSEPTLIAALVSIAIDSIATRQVEWMVSESPRDIDLLNKLRLVIRLREKTPPFSYYMRGEAVMSIAFAERWPKLSEESLQMMGFGGEDPTLKAPAGISPELAGKAYTTRALQLWTEAFEGMKAEESGLNSSKVMESISVKIMTLQDPTYMLSKVAMPVFDQAGNAFVMRTARFQAVQGMLMAVGYWQSHGKMPGSLEAAGFKGTDPFTGKPFLYKAQGDSVAVWSVGQDLKDNGGLEKENKDIVARFPRR